MGARDELSRFLDLIRNNQFASYENCGPLYKRLKDIDGCFTAIGANPSTQRMYSHRCSSSAPMAPTDGLRVGARRLRA